MPSATSELNSPWVWALPTLLLTLAALLFATGSNHALFLFLNHATAHLPDALWSQLTLLGDTSVALALLALALYRRPRLVKAALIAALFTFAWVHGLKPLLALPRPPAVLDPTLLHIIGPAHRSGSFPSGHTATAFTLAGILILDGRRPALALALLPLAALVGLSRIAVGVHWPLDVLAGAFGGWLAAATGVHLAARSHAGSGRTATLLYCALLTLLALGLLVTPAEYPAAETLKRLIAGAALLSLIATAWRQWRRHSA